MPLNLPNLLTWLRILMIPAVIGVYYVPDTWMSAGEKNLLATVLFDHLRQQCVLQGHKEGFHALKID